jgi:hypothetical protein
MNNTKTGIGVITNKWTSKTDLNEWNVGKNKPFNDRLMPGNPFLEAVPVMFADRNPEIEWNFLRGTR